MKVVIIGAGAYGRVLGKLAEQNGHTVSFYDPYVFPRVHLRTVLKSADICFYAAPASAASEILPQLPTDLTVICASKGFLSDAQFQRFADYAALSGAGYASDFDQLLDEQAPASKDQTEITLTTSSQLVMQLLAQPRLKFEYSADTLGIMLCGALKNIYALGAGLLDGGQSVAYLNLALLEMEQILALNDADPDTVRLSCGEADLRLTCSPASRNFRFGQTIAELQKQSLDDQHFFGKVAPKTLRQRLNLPKLAQGQTLESLNVIKSLDSTERFLVPPSARLFITIVNQMQPVVDSLKTAKKADAKRGKTGTKHSPGSAKQGKADAKPKLTSAQRAQTAGARQKRSRHAT